MKLRNFGLVILAALTLAACSDDDDDDEGPQSRLRVVNVSPDAGVLDVYVDGDDLESDLGYGESTGYESVAAGSRNLVITPANSDDELISINPSLAEDVDYTVLAANLVASIQPIVLTDNNDEPGSGNGRVRAVHASPGIGNVDVHVTEPGAELGTPTASNVAFGAASTYVELPAGDYQIRVTPAGALEPILIDSGTLELESGDVRTIIARDATGGGAPYALEILADRD